MKRIFLFTLVLLSATLTAYPISMSMVTISDPGNSHDPDEGWTSIGFFYGDVDYTYKIGTYEVTVAQYTAFLNDVARSDPHGLYNEGEMRRFDGGIERSGSDGNYIYIATKPNHPAILANFWSALRFTNWMTTGDTETGVYNLGGVTSPENGSISRDATAWANGGYALPTGDEWYKAAYYHPSTAGGDTDSYWLYATGTNDAPAGDEVNYNAGDGLNPGGTAEVGYSLPSYYGTYDQNGNVAEWTEEIIPGFDVYRSVTGGRYDGDAQNQYFGGVGIANATSQTTGFRVVQLQAIPEPRYAALIFGGVMLLLALRWKRQKG